MFEAVQCHTNNLDHSVAVSWFCMTVGIGYYLTQFCHAISNCVRTVSLLNLNGKVCVWNWCSVYGHASVYEEHSMSVIDVYFVLQ